MDNLTLLVKAREMAQYMIDHKFKYSNSNVRTNWADAKKTKITNCSASVCYCLQEMGVLKKNQRFWGNSNDSITYLGTNTKATILKHYELIKVGKRPKDYKKHLRAGDICFYHLHTNIFAGINKEGKMIFWDFGKASTDTKKSGGTFCNIHRAENPSQKITYILRYKG